MGALPPLTGQPQDLPVLIFRCNWHAQRMRMAGPMPAVRAWSNLARVARPCRATMCRCAF